MIGHGIYRGSVPHLRGKSALVKTDETCTAAWSDKPMVLASFDDSTLEYRQQALGRHWIRFLREDWSIVEYISEVKI